MIYLYTLLVTFLLTLLLSPVTIKISRKLGIFSGPKIEKEKGKPCLGGIAIYTAFMLVCVYTYFLIPGYAFKLTGLIISSGLVILLGLVDDARDLKPFIKIVGQLLAIGTLVVFGIFTKISFLPIWVNILITFLWVLYITNAFNLLDIVDGLTSGLVVIISLTLLIISLANKDIFSSIILASLIGAHLGFLKYNYPPARIYMGDTGSLFSGFLLAVVAINISYAPLERPLALLTPLVAMSLPIYDTVFLIVMRARKGRPIFQKSDDHFALRLVTMGYSVRRSIWIMYVFNMFLAVTSLVVAFGANAMAVAALIIVIITFIFAGKKLSVVKIK